MLKIKSFLKNFAKHPLLLLSFGLIIIIFLFSLFIKLEQANKTALTLNFAPDHAVIKINQRSVPNHNKISLKKGLYHVSVSSPNFELYEKDITIGDKDTFLAATLKPINAEGEKYQASHQREFARVEGFIGAQLATRGNELKQKFPLLHILPINNNLYSISFRYSADLDDKTNHPIITIQSDPKYLDAAVSRLKQAKNLSLSDYDINFDTAALFSKPNPSILQQTSSSDLTNPQDFVSTYYLSKHPYRFDFQKQLGDYFVLGFHFYDYANDLHYAHLRCVLKTNGDQFETITPPVPILTKFNTPSLDQPDLDKFNQ